MTGFGETEGVAATETGSRTVWRRLKEAGARANGLSGLSGDFDRGQAVAERFPRDVLNEAEARAIGEAVFVGAGGLKEEDDAGENRRASDAGEGDPGRIRFTDAKRTGARENEEEKSPVGTSEGEGQERLVQGEGAFDDWHWIAFGGYSLRVTAFSACTLLLASALAPGGLTFDGLALGAGMYVAWFAGTFWAECRGCRRGFAVVTERLGATRLGLSAVALAFLWSGDPVAAGLAVWTAAVALAIGGFDDGGWIAVVSLRREVPPWRALAVVHRESRDVWRAGWRVLYGGTFR